MYKMKKGEKIMTKREALMGIKDMIVTQGAADEYVEFIDGEIAKLDARAEKERIKREEKKAEGDELKDVIYAIIKEAKEPMTVDEVLGQIEGDDITRGKVTYRAGVLVKEGLVNKVEVKIDKRKVVAYIAA